MNEMTRLFSAIERGDSRAAEQLLPLVYGELRRLAAQRLAQEAPGKHFRRLPWSMKLTCVWLVPRIPVGMAAATSSPRPPRRCAGS